MCHEPISNNRPEDDDGDSLMSEPGSKRLRTGALAVPTDTYYSILDFSTYLMIASEAGSAGLAFEIRAGDQMYMAEISIMPSELVLLRSTPEEKSVLGRSMSKLQPRTWYLLRVQSFGGRIRVELDDEVTIEATVSVPNWGMIGAWATHDTRACFDELAASPTAPDI